MVRRPPTPPLFPYTTLFRSEREPAHAVENRLDRVLRRTLDVGVLRSEEHTSELHHANISYAVFCLKKKRPRSVRPKHTQTHVRPGRDEGGVLASAGYTVSPP